jgi:hypothetical protein
MSEKQMGDELFGFDSNFASIHVKDGEWGISYLAFLEPVLLLKRYIFILFHLLYVP